MAKQNDQIKIMAQIIRRMEKHNLSEATVGNIRLKKEKPQDIGDLAQQEKLDENMKAEAKRIAKIRLHCPYPCPHWPSESPKPE